MSKKNMKKRIVAGSLAIAVVSLSLLLVARDRYGSTKTQMRCTDDSCLRKTRTKDDSRRRMRDGRRPHRMTRHGVRHHGSAFLGKYLQMSESEQKMINADIKAFIDNNAQDVDFVTNLAAVLNSVVGLPADSPLSYLVNKVATLQTKAEKVNFLKHRWQRLTRRSGRYFVVKAARFAGFAQAVEQQGLQSEFSKELNSIKDHLFKLDDKGMVPALSEKDTERLKEQEVKVEESAQEPTVMVEQVETVDEDIL